MQAVEPTLPLLVYQVWWTSVKRGGVELLGPSSMRAVARNLAQARFQVRFELEKRFDSKVFITWDDDRQQPGHPLWPPVTPRFPASFPVELQASLFPQPPAHP